MGQQRRRWHRLTQLAVPLRVKQLSAGEPLGQPRANCPHTALDFGSSSLVIPFWRKSGGRTCLPTGFRRSYGNGVSIVYADVPLTVVRWRRRYHRPPVHVGICRTPRNLDSPWSSNRFGGAFGLTETAYWASGRMWGRMPSAGQQHFVTTDLPGQLSWHPHRRCGYMQFGSNTNSNASVTGAPITVLNSSDRRASQQGLLVLPSFRFGRQPRAERFRR